jgi:glycosyltransferase involved in cell wall biosynthesis
VNLLVIQVPAYNEEGHVGAAVAALPKSVPGFSRVAVLVVDDGSTDATGSEARAAGAAEVVAFPVHRGLAAAFSAGIARALAMGADCIVNFDADSQYDPADLPLLTEPIVRGEAEIVVGDRGADALPHFSFGKRLLQRAGSWVVRQASGTEVADATSGFRALSREAAESLHVFSKMTYTLETLIQAGAKGMRIRSVRVRARRTERRSRVVRSNLHYVLVSGANILRITALYKPLKVFSAAAAVLVAAGLALVARFFWFYFGPRPGGHVQSLIVAAILIVVGVQTFLIALLADLVSINRTLLERLAEPAPAPRGPRSGKTSNPESSGSGTSD